MQDIIARGLASNAVEKLNQNILDVLESEMIVETVDGRAFTIPITSSTTIDGDVLRDKMVTFY